MLKTLLAPFVALFTSGVLFHRSSFIGIVCAVWIFVTADSDAGMFSRLGTPDLYLLMVSFLLLYRVTLKRTYTDKHEIDIKNTLIYLAGDVAWAVLAMFCATFFLLSFSAGDTKTSVNPYADIENAAQNLPPQVRQQIKQELRKHQLPFF